MFHNTWNIGFPDMIKTIAEKLLKYEDPFNSVIMEERMYNDLSKYHTSHVVRSHNASLLVWVSPDSTCFSPSSKIQQSHKHLTWLNLGQIYTARKQISRFNMVETKFKIKNSIIEKTKFCTTRSTGTLRCWSTSNAFLASPCWNNKWKRH